MRQIVAFFALATTLTCAAQAQTSREDQARIQLLEDQVLELKTELRRLKLVLSELRTDLTKLSKSASDSSTEEIAKDMDPASECQARIESMQIRLDQLLSLGFRESHPDAVNLTKSIEALQARCGPGTP